MFRILEAESKVSLVRENNIAQQELKDFLVDEDVETIAYLQDLEARVERQQAEVAHKTRMPRYRDFADTIATCVLMNRPLLVVKTSWSPRMLRSLRTSKI